VIDTDTKRAYTMVKRAWCKEAADALASTFVGEDGGKRIVDGVMSERLELWRVNDDSWAVTEVLHGMLFLWCYAGRGSVQFVERLILIARKMGLEQVSFFSFHKGAARLWHHYNPRKIPGGNPGEVQYIFEVKV
jgi:hypothetical protein